MWGNSEHISFPLNQPLQPRSEAMSKRNVLFKKSIDMLTSDGVKPDQARKIVSTLFEKDRTMNKKCLMTNFGTKVMENEEDCRVLTDAMCQNMTSTCDPQFKFRLISKSVRYHITFLIY